MTLNCEAIDLTDASDVCNIFKLFEGIHQTEDKANEPYDITNGLSVIRVYSSINAQTFGLNSPLIDNLIHVSMGLNNMITWDNLLIVVDPNYEYYLITYNTISDMFNIQEEQQGV